MTEIERPLTSKDGQMMNTGTKTFLDFFLAVLHEKEQKYTAEHKPYDRACARIDYEDKFNSIIKEIERAEGGFLPNDPRLKIDFGDLERYGDSARFQKVGESPEVVDRLIDGMRIPYRTGTSMLYVCKQRGHRCSVTVPSELILDKAK